MVEFFDNFIEKTRFRRFERTFCDYFECFFNKTKWKFKLDRYRVIESWKTAKGCQLQLLSMKNCCLSVPAVRKLGEAILHFEHLTQQYDFFAKILID